MPNGRALLNRKSHLPVTDIAPLTTDELAQVFEKRTVTEPGLQRVRKIHHKVARLLATGMKGVEVSAVTGLAYTRIMMLKSDPAFQELLAHYEAEETERWQEVRDQAEMVGVSAVEELQDRLESSPDKIPTGQLINIAKLGLDYGGHKPAERWQGELSHTVTSETLAKLKAERNETVRVRKGDENTSRPEAGEVFDGEYRPVDETRDQVREESSPDAADSDAAVG